MSPDISQFFSFLDNSLAQSIILVLRIIFIVFSAGMIGFIIFALFKTAWLKRLTIWDWKEFLTYHPYGVRKLYRQWQKTKLRLETGLESEYKLAIIEGDSVIEDVLKRMGFSGETLGERLANVTEETIPNLPDVVDAHKIRNNIVHDPDYRLTLDDAKKAIEVYEKALTDLQAL